MRGRGYFRSQLAQLNAAKNQEEQNDVQTPVPVITNAHTPFANRGRQVICIILNSPKFCSRVYFKNDSFKMSLKLF